MTSRQRKTDRQRAEEALGVAQRRVVRLEKQAQDARDHLDALDYELGAARRRLDYAGQDPALGTTTAPTTDQAGATA